MKQIKILFLTTFCIALSVMKVFPKTDYQVTVELNGDSTALKQAIATNASLLLTNLNAAAATNKTPKLSNEIATEDVKKKILAIWESCAIAPTDSVFHSQLLPAAYGDLQIRDIAVLIVEKASQNPTNENIALNFDKTGKINDVYITLKKEEGEVFDNIEQNDFVDFEDLELTDESKTEELKQAIKPESKFSPMISAEFITRQKIRDFVEKLRTAYNCKDMDFLENVYSDNALIINAVERKGKQIPNTDYIKITLSTDKYNMQIRNKRQYLDKLKQVFKQNAWINISFDNVKLVEHATVKNVFGVSLFQKWKAQKYSDEGYLFLLIDCRKEYEMEIFVRAWAPEEIFNMNSFSGFRFFDI